MYTIRMQHPAKNALDLELVAWLDAELDKAGDAPVLVTGSENAFCAGLNLKKVAAADAAGVEALLVALDAFCQRLFEHPAPTVAAINGHAIAGGCVIAQCCDVRYVTDNPKARLGLNEVALGALFPPRILRILRHRLPTRSQHEVLLGAGLFDPSDALRVGLVDAVVADVEQAATAMLERAAQHPAAALRHTKAILTAGVAEADAAELLRFQRVEIPRWTHQELRDRIHAVLGG